MFETADDMDRLQALLDTSYQRSGSHLRSIVEPQRRLSAERIVAELRDTVAVLSVATVNGAGEPRISAVDGYFIGGRWMFATSSTSAKSAMLRANPAVSAAWAPRDGFGVFCHGTARPLTDPVDSANLRAQFALMYGVSPDDVVEAGAGDAEQAAADYFAIDAHWMVGFAMTDEDQVEIDASLAARAQRIAARDAAARQV